MVLNERARVEVMMDKNEKDTGILTGSKWSMAYPHSSPRYQLTLQLK